MVRLCRAGRVASLAATLSGKPGERGPAPTLKWSVMTLLSATPHRAGRSIRLAPALTLLPGLAHRRQNDRVKSTAIGTISTRPSSISRDSITFDKSVKPA